MRDIDSITAAGLTALAGRPLVLARERYVDPPHRRTLTVDTSALDGLTVAPTSHINPRHARVIPAEGAAYELVLDGRPRRPGAVLHAFIHEAVYAELARRQGVARAATA